MISVINMGSNNIFSLIRAIKFLGYDYKTINKGADVMSANKIILPGVGSFEDGMNFLHKNQLVEPLREVHKKKIPILGICLGMQLMADYGMEFGKNEGLGLINGKVISLTFDPNNPNHNNRVPNIGWRSLNIVKKNNILFEEILSNSMVYFIHSYYIELNQKSHLLATIDVNGRNITAAFNHLNLYGVQFHPERSGKIGLSILDGFAKL